MQEQNRLTQQSVTVSVMRGVFIIAGIVALTACNSSRVARQPLERFYAQQTMLTDVSQPFPYYVYCTYDSDWRCWEPTAKTPLQQASYSAPAMQEQAMTDAGPAEMMPQETGQMAGENGAKQMAAKEDAMAEEGMADARAGAVMIKKGDKPLTIVYFDFDRDELKDNAINKLKDMLPHIKEKHVLLQGYTDSIGGKPYNNDLAVRRAKRVEAFLRQNNAGAEKIEVMGEGLCCYVVENSTAQNRALNRRVEVHQKSQEQAQ